MAFTHFGTVDELKSQLSLRAPISASTFRSLAVSSLLDSDHGQGAAPPVVGQGIIGIGAATSQFYFRAYDFDVVVNAAPSVVETPEPSTLVIFCTGIACLLVRLSSLPDQKANFCVALRDVNGCRTI